MIQEVESLIENSKIGDISSIVLNDDEELIVECERFKNDGMYDLNNYFPTEV